MTAELEISVPAKITILDDDGVPLAIRYYRPNGAFIDKGQPGLFDTPAMAEMVKKAEESLK